MSKFIKVTETTRYNLEDGDWIEFKNRLSYGEEQRLASSGMQSMRPVKNEYDTEADTSNEMMIDFEKYSIDRIFIWGIDWNFTDDNSKTVRFTRTAISALNPDIAQEINDLLDSHVEKIESLKVMKNSKISNLNTTKK